MREGGRLYVSVNQYHEVKLKVEPIHKQILPTLHNAIIT